MQYKVFYEDYHGRVSVVTYTCDMPKLVVTAGRAAVREAKQHFQEKYPNVRIHRRSFVLKFVQEVESGRIVYPARR